MRTLFLNPPSYDDFDGGAGSRYQAKREVWSFWYPTWLCYPAGMLPGARVLDAPPHDVSPEETVRIARDFDLLVVHTSTPSFRADVRTAQAIKDVKPEITIGFVGGHVTAMPEESLRYAPVIDFVARKEFDLAVVAVPERGQRAGGGVAHEAALPQDEGALLRRRHLHRRSAARARDRARPRQDGHHLVDQLARQRRPRDLEGLEGWRAPPLRRRLRVGERADLEEHPQGGERGARPSLHPGLPRARHPDPRDLHPGPPGRDPRHHPGDHALRARDAARDAPGLARLALPGHRLLRLRDEEQLPHRRQPGR